MENWKTIYFQLTEKGCQINSSMHDVYWNQLNKSEIWNSTDKNNKSVNKAIIDIFHSNLQVLLAWRYEQSKLAGV